MNHEKIKIGETTYDIANGSCSLDVFDGGPSRIAIIIGSNTIDSIHKTLSENSTIAKYDRDGKEEWRRDDLVYTGKMTLNANFPVGIEQVENGTDEEGKPVFINREAKDSVVIVEYRAPTIRDEVKAQRAKLTGLDANVSHLATITGVGVEASASGQMTLEELKAAKKAEINAACGQAVCNGVTVELSTGFEHFSLSQSDQINLFGLQAQLTSGVEQVVYHADGEPCRYYPASDLSLLIDKAMFHVSYHITYANSLKSWIDGIATADELQEVYFGADVPAEYQSEVLKAYLAQIAAMAGEEK